MAQENSNQLFKEINDKLGDLALQENTNRLNIANLTKDLETQAKGLKEVLDIIKKEYVTLTEFHPVKLIAYGLVAGVLITVLGAVVGVVIIG